VEETVAGTTKDTDQISKLYLHAAQKAAFFFAIVFKFCLTLNNNCLNMKTQTSKNNDSKWFGFILILVGIAWLLNNLEIDIFPEWLIRWQVLLIAIGLAIGVSSRFQNPASFILIVIGGIFLARDIFDIPIEGKAIWPTTLILVGMLIFFTANRKRRNFSQVSYNSQVYQTENPNHDSSDFIVERAVFYGSKRNISSNSFKGGDLVIVFGGTELDLTQCQIQKEAIMNLVVVFGGLKLTVPNDWVVTSEVVNILAGMEDKRDKNIPSDTNKKLTLSGTLIFGGIEISNR